MRTYTMGANADSYYEYLLKMWLLKQQKVLPSAPVLAEKQAKLCYHKALTLVAQPCQREEEGECCGLTFCIVHI